MKDNVEKSEIKRFIIVFIVLIAILGAVYLLTSIFVTKDAVQGTEDATIPGTINYSTAIVGNMLTKPEDTYYVFVYDGESKNSELYTANNAILEYLSDEDAIKFYNVDLAQHMNMDYKADLENDEETNPKATTVEDFLFGDFTVVKVKDGKVNKYLDTVEEIEKELK